jgi:hypothetical protein
MKQPSALCSDSPVILLRSLLPSSMVSSQYGSIEISLIDYILNNVSLFSESPVATGLTSAFSNNMLCPEGGTDTSLIS